MSNTLKENYAHQQLEMMIEAIDPQKLQKMVQNIGTIESVLAPVRNKLPNLANAVEQAKQLAGAKLSGEGGAWHKMAQNVNDKFKIVDDMKKFITFQASILQGLRALPTIITLLKKSGIDVENKNATEALEATFAKDPESRLRIVKALAGAFTPPGGIFTNKKVPFVKDIQVLATDFFNLTPTEIDQMAKRAGTLPGIPITGQDAKEIMNSSNADAAQKMAGGQEQNATGKDASGKSTQVEPAGAGTTSGTPAVSQGSKTNTKMPEFNAAMQAIGAKNMDRPENKKTIDAFRRFYDYLSKNAG